MWLRTECGWIDQGKEQMRARIAVPSLYCKIGAFYVKRLLSNTRWRTLAVAGIGSALLISTLAACGSASKDNANGKNCKHVAFLLPESATAARWEAADHPLVEAAIKDNIPGVTVDVLNAQGNATQQQT